MKKILVPVDFSEHSEYALEAAVKIAQTQNAEVIALHMMGISEAVISKNDPQEVFEALYYLKLVEKKFIEFLDKDFLEGVHIEQAVCNYNQFTEINNLAKKYEADLIVMGSHGSSGISEIFVGSNTEKVVRTSEIPVVVIKNKFKIFEFKNIVFACDFEEESRNAYEKAMNLFQELNANVHLLHVNLPNEKFRSTAQIEEKVKLFLNMVNPSDVEAFDKVTFVNDYSVEDGVFSFSEKIDADAISIATHGRRGLAHFFFGSVGEDLANHSDIPVFTFRR